MPRRKAAPLDQNPKIRMTTELRERIRAAQVEMGYISEADWVRDACCEKLDRQKYERQMQDRVTATLKAQAGSVKAIRTGLELLFSTVVAQTKLMMLYSAEPYGRALEDNLNTLSARMEQFRRDVAHEFNGAAGEQFEDLTEDAGEELALVAGEVA
jgi:Arc/MetJ-type ribon-helix-helix transcriptional regulator